jgi:hypothetical protein
MLYSSKLLALSPILYLTSLQQPTPVEPTWVKTDQKLISSLVTSIKAGPKQVEHFYHVRNGIEKEEKLGFGWTYKKARAGGGYVSIPSVLYYENGRLISYIIYPQLPQERDLATQYQSWYSSCFSIDSKGVVPVQYNSTVLHQALLSYKATPTVSTDILQYMSPASGTEYGYTGGFAGTVLANRKNFLAIRSQLRPQDILLIMHAINPASRLTAIEYYWRHKKLFTNHLTIDQWVERVFNELPQVDTMFGCIAMKSSARTLVHKYSQTN